MNPHAILFVAAAATASALPALPVNLLNQYHAQDELGQYTYGYSGGPSSKHESRTVDGITRGTFSYIDSNGLVQSRSYVSDPVNGFRVAASDVPDGHPEAVAVAAAPVVSTYSAAVPAVVPAAVPVPASSTIVESGVHSQYHSQDEHGQYRYGYSGGSSAKEELKTADGITRGAFAYVDGHGRVQTRRYVADDVNGFRVAASDLPVGPSPVAAAPVIVATPVESPIIPVAPVSAVAPVAPLPVAPVAPVDSLPVAPVEPVASAPVATVPVAPVDSGAAVAPVQSPAAVEAPASDASSDSVVVDAA